MAYPVHFFFFQINFFLVTKNQCETCKLLIRFIVLTFRQLNAVPALLPNETNYIAASKINDIIFQGAGNFTPQSTVTNVVLNVDDVTATAQIIDVNTVQMNLNQPVLTPDDLRYVFYLTLSLPIDFLYLFPFSVILQIDGLSTCEGCQRSQGTKIGTICKYNNR